MAKRRTTRIHLVASVFEPGEMFHILNSGFITIMVTWPNSTLSRAVRVGMVQPGLEVPERPTKQFGLISQKADSCFPKLMTRGGASLIPTRAAGCLAARGLAEFRSRIPTMSSETFRNWNTP